MCNTANPKGLTVNALTTFKNKMFSPQPDLLSLYVCACQSKGRYTLTQIALCVGVMCVCVSIYGITQHIGCQGHNSDTDGGA